MKLDDEVSGKSLITVQSKSLIQCSQTTIQEFAK